MTFPEMLSEAMGSMSQADLADETGLRQATISRYLSGKRKPSYEAQLALERRLPRLRELHRRQVAA